MRLPINASRGSQYFLYSAWGLPSLTDYNSATDDLQAVQDFLNEYEYWWAQAIPVVVVLKQQGVLGQNSG